MDYYCHEHTKLSFYADVGARDALARYLTESHPQWADAFDVDGDGTLSLEEVEYAVNATAAGTPTVELLDEGELRRALEDYVADTCPPWPADVESQPVVGVPSPPSTRGSTLREEEFGPQDLG